MKIFTKILALLLTLQGVYSQHLEDYEELHTIQEYIRYVDSITANLYNDALAITKKTCEEIVSSVPVEQRGEITAALRKFSDDATRAELSSDNDEKKAVIDSLNSVMMNSFQPGSPPTQEVMVVGMKMFSIAAALKKRDDYRNAKLVSASNYLESLFSPEGISRNQRLFDLIRPFANVDDQTTRDQNLKELLALKE